MKKAFRTKDKLAEQCYNLACLYEISEDIPRNKKKALKLFIKAAKNGHKQSQQNLYVMYASGVGARYSERMANYWFNIYTGSK